MAFVEKVAQSIPRSITPLTSILKKIVSRFSAKNQNARSERVFVGAFGKHPGWNDHIDDIGFETDVFVSVKRLLYIQGIGGNIDAGSWDKLEDGQALREFKHVFVWCLDKNVILGRLWSSRDGKGRTSYPMVVCVQCRQLPLDWILKNILPRLEKVEQTCAATVSATDVYTSIDNARDEFRRLAQQCPPSTDLLAPHTSALAKLAEDPEMGPHDEGLLRILYHIEREVARYGPADSTKTKEFRATFLRIPASPACASESALLWISFLLARLGRSTPVLVLMPLRHAWVDVIIGEPTQVQLYCLRVSLDVIPLTSSIPYNMDAEFIDRTRQLIETSRQNANAQSSGDTA